MDSEHQPLLCEEQEHSFDIITRFYEKMMPKVAETCNKLNNFDFWGRSACIFYSLTWISWGIASLSIPSFIKPFLLTVLVFPSLLLALYNLQSLMFFFDVHAPLTRSIGCVGFGILHEIVYPNLEGNSLLTFAFAFQQTGLILQYRYYSGIHHSLIPVDFRKQGTVMMEILVLHLIRTWLRGVVNYGFVEAGPFLVPILVGWFAIICSDDLLRKFGNWVLSVAHETQVVFEELEPGEAAAAAAKVAVATEEEEGKRVEEYIVVESLTDELLKDFLSTLTNSSNI